MKKIMVTLMILAAFIAVSTLNVQGTVQTNAAYAGDSNNGNEREN